MADDPTIDHLTPHQLWSLLAAGAVALVDVREPDEFRAERIDGACNIPLSGLDPQTVFASVDRPIVFHCGSGKRSATAIGLCRQAGGPVDSHLAGGILAWKAAGLATTTLDGAGSARDPA